MWRMMYILIIFVAVSCAPKMTVLVDGYPMSQEQEYLRVPDPEVGIRIQYYVAGWIKKDLGGEELEPYPIYFRINEKEYLPDNVEAVTLNAWIKNPKNIEYKINSWVDVSKPHTRRVSKIEPVCGLTSKLNNFITIHGPVDPGSTIRLRAVLYDNQGLPLVAIGDAYYKVKRPENKELHSQ